VLISLHCRHINAFGSKVVWTGDDGDAVYMYDVSTGEETQLSPAGIDPDIYGNYVVYTNNYSISDNPQNYAIYLYDLSTHNETKIAKVHSSPAIYGTKVIWFQATLAMAMILKNMISPLKKQVH
jgi:hypothetical protein